MFKSVHIEKSYHLNIRAVQKWSDNFEFDFEGKLLLPIAQILDFPIKSQNLTENLNFYSIVFIGIRKNLKFLVNRFQITIYWNFK